MKTKYKYTSFTKPFTTRWYCYRGRGGVRIAQLVLVSGEWRLDAADGLPNAKETADIAAFMQGLKEEKG